MKMIRDVVCKSNQELKTADIVVVEENNISPSSPPAKRLKQSRLPFSQIIQLSQVSSNSSNSPNRKLGCKESVKPSQCQQTVADKSQCKDSPAAIAKDENKISSSTENVDAEDLCEEIVVDVDPQSLNSSVAESENNFADITGSDEPDDKSIEIECISCDDDKSDDDKHEESDLEKVTTPSQKKSTKSPIVTKAERLHLKQQKAEEREKKRLSLEQDRLEKNRLKEELKRKKEEEKRKKEEEKRNEILAKETKKQEVLQQKEEKKREKELKQQHKIELIEAKQEEKRKKELEKSLREEEEQRKKEKRKAAFVGFFVKKELNSSLTEESPSPTQHGLFKSFEIKENMRVAPIFRYSTTDKSQRKQLFDASISSQDSSRLYLLDLKNKTHQAGNSGRTWPRCETEEEIQVVNEKDGDREQPTFPRVKLLQFHDNVRPPYWGTWRKESSSVNPRKPFNKHTSFDYEVDSDDEWENEEPGESLSGTEDEKESEDEYEIDNKLFVPHGYLSDGENQDEDDVTVPSDGRKIKLKLEELEFEKERKEKCEQIKPKVFGCIWMDNKLPELEELLKLLTPFKAVLMEANLQSLALKSPKSSEKNDASCDVKRRRRHTKPVPEEAMPYLIRLFHGNPNKSSVLMGEFLEFWRQHIGEQQQANVEDLPETVNNLSKINGGSTETKVSPLRRKKDVSKRQLQMTLRDIVMRDRLPEKPFSSLGKMWLVKEEVLVKYGLSDLTLPNQWHYVTVKQDEVKILNMEAILTKSEPEISSPKTPNVFQLLSKQAENNPCTPSSTKQVTHASLTQTPPSSAMISTPKPKRLTIDKFLVRSSSNMFSSKRVSPPSEVIVLDDDNEEEMPEEKKQE